MAQGTGRNDAILLAAVWRAGRPDPPADGLSEILELASAPGGSAELGLEAGAQGSALRRTLRGGWTHPALDGLHRQAQALQVAPAYPVVFGMAAAVHRIPLRPARLAYLHAFAAMIVSAGVRLIPLGQTDGQRLTVATEPLIEAVALEAAGAGLDDLGSAALVIDLCSMAHETQSTRLFRS